MSKHLNNAYHNLQKRIRSQSSEDHVESIEAGFFTVSIQGATINLDEGTRYELEHSKGPVAIVTTVASMTKDGIFCIIIPAKEIPTDYSKTYELEDLPLYVSHAVNNKGITEYLIPFVEKDGKYSLRPSNQPIYYPVHNLDACAYLFEYFHPNLFHDGIKGAINYAIKMNNWSNDNQMFWTSLRLLLFSKKEDLVMPDEDAYSSVSDKSVKLIKPEEEEEKKTKKRKEDLPKKAAKKVKTEQVNGQPSVDLYNDVFLPYLHGLEEIMRKNSKLNVYDQQVKIFMSKNMPTVQCKDDLMRILKETGLYAFLNIIIAHYMFVEGKQKSETEAEVDSSKEECFTLHEAIEDMKKIHAQKMESIENIHTKKMEEREKVHDQEMEITKKVHAQEKEKWKEDMVNMKNHMFDIFQTGVTCLRDNLIAKMNEKNN